MSVLAGSHSPGAAGLPRGRGRLPAAAVAEEQRMRMMRAMVSAAAERGYHDVTVAEVVRRARVSREAFYRQFAGKYDCLLAAMDWGRKLIFERVRQARETSGPTSFGDEVRSIVRTYLHTCAEEPEFARVWALDMATAAPDSASLQHEFVDQLAALLRYAHGAWTDRDGQPARPFETYVALIGGCYELTRRYATDRRPAQVVELEDTLVELIVAGLR